MVSELDTSEIKWVVSIVVPLEHSKINLAVSSAAVHYFADLLLLDYGEPVVPQRERLEGGLPSEEHEQRCHALIPVLKPQILF